MKWFGGIRQTHSAILESVLSKGEIVHLCGQKKINNENKDILAGKHQAQAVDTNNKKLQFATLID